MQHASHDAPRNPRFFVNTRGELVDRVAKRGQRTGYSIVEKHATRSEMHILADMLNEPDMEQAYDAGAGFEWQWAARIAQAELAQQAGTAA